MNYKVDKILAVFQWLIALHSFVVGIGLIILPSSAFKYLGFDSTFDRFFSTQGGVFHIVMAVGYSLAAYNTERYKSLIVFTIIVKLTAAVFLFIYYVIASSQLLIIVSCISDLIMGICIIILFRLSSIKTNKASQAL